MTSPQGVLCCQNKSQLSHLQNGHREKLFLTQPFFQWFLNGQKWGVKKASLYVHFEGLTTDSSFGKTRPPGEVILKKFFLTLFDKKTWFLTFLMVFKLVKNGDGG